MSSGPEKEEWGPGGAGLVGHLVSEPRAARELGACGTLAFGIFQIEKKKYCKEVGIPDGR